MAVSSLGFASRGGAILGRCLFAAPRSVAPFGRRVGLVGWLLALRAFGVCVCVWVVCAD